MMTTIMWIILVTLFLVASSFLAKKFFKTDSYLGIFILIKTKKLMKVLDWLSKKKILEKISTIGIVVGFGAFGLDYVHRNKKLSVSKRILLFVLYSLGISLIVYFMFYNVFLGNPMISSWGGYLIIFLTGVLGLSGMTLGSLVYSGIDIIIKTFFLGTTAAPGIGLVLPGIKMPKVNFVIPWYGWIILIFSAAVHEFFHGAMLKRYKLKVKSIGIILAGIFPFGAFVEPDEKQIKRKDKHKVMKMYSAGPTSNAIIALIFFIIAFLFSSLLFTNTQGIYGIQVTNVPETLEIEGQEYISPAYGVLNVDDVVVSVNDQDIKAINDMSDSTIPDEENRIFIINKNTKKERTEYIIPTKGKYGINGEIVGIDPKTKNIYSLKDYASFNKNPLLLLIYNIIFWIALLNLLISSVNFLPTVPFDGGFMSQVIFSRYLKKGTSKAKSKKIAKFFAILIIILFLANIIPYFI
jgi:membrane-associated protease RseP (regulator of RpoE activity)